MSTWQTQRFFASAQNVARVERSASRFDGLAKSGLKGKQEMTEDTKRPVALVTGASRRQGIGAATCIALAKNGHDIAFTYWQAYDRQMDYTDEGGPPALVAELDALGARVWQAEVDLSDPSAPAKLLDDVTEGLGFPTVLVNNAAHST